jgi:hypothetical protein
VSRRHVDQVVGVFDLFEALAHLGRRRVGLLGQDRAQAAARLLDQPRGLLVLGREDRGERAGRAEQVPAAGGVLDLLEEHARPAAHDDRVAAGRVAGDLHHLADHADRQEIARSGRFERRVALGDEQEAPALRDGRVDARDRDPAPHLERQHHAGQDDLAPRHQDG